MKFKEFKNKVIKEYSKECSNRFYKYILERYYAKERDFVIKFLYKLGQEYNLLKEK